jgi:hypothetical protein
MEPSDLSWIANFGGQLGEIEDAEQLEQDGAGGVEQ